jgi:hypothetical protein
MLLTGAGAFPVSFAVLFFCYFLLFCFLLFCFGSRVVEVVVCRRGDFLVRFQFGVGVFSGSVFLLLDLVWTLTDLRCGGGGCRICDSLVYLVFSAAFSGSRMVFRCLHSFGGVRSRFVPFRR